MSKLEINNEIVLMRHTVRQARLHVVRKLIKQVKNFGSKKGDEKQLEKYKRKGDKLGHELSALKKLKDDEISRYSITNENINLEEILADKKSEANIRVLARLASHKSIRDRVAKFKEKFHNFEEHLGPGRKKLMKLKRKAGKQAKKEAKSIAENSEKVDEDKLDENDSGNGDTDFIGNEEESEESLSREVENKDSESSEVMINSRKRKTESISARDKKIKTIKSEDKLAGICPTSKEAAVKSFARFLEETGEEISESRSLVGEESMNGNKIVLEKEVDSFFMTEDGGGEYLSVVVPKSNITENEEMEEIRARGELNTSFQSRNNRFFDKVDDKRVDRTKHKRDGFKERIEGPRADNKNRRNNNNNNNNNNNHSKGIKYEGDARGPEKSANENTMHPSWAAKKKQQEILKLGFQGKKIIFDDI